ncbi:hypothetical protein BGZ63DRAFT_412505 [Mariannaea sp. PMI_226]|nr:hypothetical protein BGZ63DRAFT_412505 [Mariannaea sp. PMI_226]
MDIKDVSDNGDYIGFLNQILRLAERAGQRKGQMVQDHPNPEQILSNFMMNLSLSNLHSSSMDSSHAIATTQVPPPYSPCIHPITKLKPVMISEMRLETHHRGTSLLLRVLTPPQRMTAVMAIVEDERGTAVLLQLYHQPEEILVPADEIVKLGRVCILKEPYFKCATDGAYSLRVDHVSDIVWLDQADGRIPRKWRKKELSFNSCSQSIRIQGNDAVRNQKWAEAQRLYSSAIREAKTPEEEQLAFLNRSLVNLRLGRPEQAMLDANKGSAAAVLSEKRLFREARALYELANFEQCLDKLQRLAELYPENTAAKQEMLRAEERLHEQQTGDYVFSNLYRQAKSTPPLIDCATFSDAVEVRPSPGRGRGLFTNRPVAAGELLLVEKAFSYCYAGGDQSALRSVILMNLATKKMTMGGQAGLLTQVIQKLYHGSQEQSTLYTDLHCTDYPRVSVLKSDGVPIVDSFLVERIISLNSFGCPRTTKESFSEIFSDRVPTKSRGVPCHTTCGIWLLASRINHSCVGNCRRSFIGDVQIVRGTKYLPEGTELFFSYRTSTSLESYETTQKQLSNWGFECDCQLCRDKKATPKLNLKRLNMLFKDLEDAFGGPSGTNVSQVRRLLKKLEENYHGREAKRVRMELWDPYFSLGAHLLSANQPGEAIKAIVKGLETLGYGIALQLPNGDVKLAQLDVKEWGRVNDFVPWAFVNLFKACRQLAPELCSSVRQYAEISYSMVVGEKESILDLFPELR